MYHRCMSTEREEIDKEVFSFFLSFNSSKCASISPQSSIIVKDEFECKLLGM